MILCVQFQATFGHIQPFFRIIRFSDDFFAKYTIIFVTIGSNMLLVFQKLNIACDCLCSKRLNKVFHLQNEEKKMNLLVRERESKKM